MKIFNREPLQGFKEKYAEARSQVESWEAEVGDAQWDTPHDLKQHYQKASILKNKQVIFDFCRNKYRLWVQVSYQNKMVFVKKIGTHREYDKWKIE